MSTEDILNAAELVGGKPMRQLAEFYVSGALPEGVNVQTIIDEISTDPDLRPELVSLVHAATTGTLDGWALSHEHDGAKRLTRLLKRDFATFAQKINESLQGHSVAEAARMLGVSRRQMHRYVKEVRDRETETQSKEVT